MTPLNIISTSVKYVSEYKTNTRTHRNMYTSGTPFLLVNNNIFVIKTFLTFYISILLKVCLYFFDMSIIQCVSPTELIFHTLSIHDHCHEYHIHICLWRVEFAKLVKQNKYLIMFLCELPKRPKWYLFNNCKETQKIIFKTT